MENQLHPVDSTKPEVVATITIELLSDQSTRCGIAGKWPEVVLIGELETYLHMIKNQRLQKAQLEAMKQQSRGLVVPTGPLPPNGLRVSP